MYPHGGCCLLDDLRIEAIRIAISAIEKQDNIIDKAVAWLENNAVHYVYNKGWDDAYIPECAGSMFIDFRKAMEE